MEEKKLNFLLMGKTGQGKSATGNTILGRRVFKTSSNVNSETKDVSFNFAQFDKYTLLMVDGPGLEDTDMDKVQDKTTAVRNIDKALAMCYGGVDAFLLVTKFGNRFTQEDKDSLEALKSIFGDEFVKHVIVVVTCGDNFEGSPDEEPKKSFHEWCSEQRECVFKELYRACDKRFVLFNNRESDDGKKRAQILKVVQFAESLQTNKGRYTRQCFETAKCEQEKLILKMRAPHLKEKFQEKISLLVAAIEGFAAQPSDDEKEKIRARIDDLRKQIDKEDRGSDVLKELKETITQIEKNLNDVEKLVKLGKKLEETRQAKKTWSLIGTICTIAGGVISVLTPPVGAAVAGASLFYSGLRWLSLTEDEKIIQQKLLDNKKS